MPQSAASTAQAQQYVRNLTDDQCRTLLVSTILFLRDAARWNLPVRGDVVEDLAHHLRYTRQVAS